MKIRLVILFFLTSCIINTELYAFSIEPARVELSIPAGNQRGKTVVIDNSKSAEPLHLKVYVQDIIFLPDGTSNFLPVGSTDWSCGEWVKVIPEEIDVPAGKTQGIRVNVAVPEGVSGGYYAMVFFESGLGHIEGLGINFRLGAFLDVSIPNTEVREAKLFNLAFVRPRQLEVGIFNTGNVLIRPKGAIKVLDSRGKKIKQLHFNPQRLGVLPKTVRKFNLELDESLVVNKYSIRAEIDLGTKYLLIGEVPIE